MIIIANFFVWMPFNDDGIESGENCSADLILIVSSVFKTGRLGGYLITCRRGSVHCYGQWLLSIGNGLFQQKPHNQSKQNCVELKTSVGPPSKQKFIKIGGELWLPIQVKLLTGGVFFRHFVQQANSRP
jgi:hypothetical protein